MVIESGRPANRGDVEAKSKDLFFLNANDSYLLTIHSPLGQLHPVNPPRGCKL